MKAKKEKKITRIEPVRTTQFLEKTQIRRVCAYCRVSTDSEHQKNSFEVQVAYYSHLIGEHNNWIFRASMQMKQEVEPGWMAGTNFENDAGLSTWTA